MSETYASGMWDKHSLEALRQALLRGNAFTDEYRRKGHSEFTRLTDTELQARADAIDAWQKLTQELEAKGYLRHAYCYECNGALEPVTETASGEWVYDETVEEHRARVNPSGDATVTFKVVDR